MRMKKDGVKIRDNLDQNSLSSVTFFFPSLFSQPRIPELTAFNHIQGRKENLILFFVLLALKFSE